jgi:hypothetical protein
VDSRDDRVLRDDASIRQDGALGVKSGDEAAPLELREERELTEV